MKRTNKIERIMLSGGLIGHLMTNPRKALDKAVAQANSEGYYCRQIQKYTSPNLFMLFISALVLTCTLGLWTFGSGYLLLLEREEG